MSDVSTKRAAYIRAIVAERAARSRLIFRRKQGKRAIKLRRLLARTRLNRRKAKKAYEAAKARANRPLRLKALDEARNCIGIMEQGGNNVGRDVEEIIREGGGVRGQAWCGWFCAAMYKRAGSKLIEWRWGAVRLLGYIAGIRKVSDPKPGDLVVFTFDHVGIYERAVNGSTIQTIEGNTGASGAVSDSSTGGDGVYRKNRSKSLVSHYLRVTR